MVIKGKDQEDMCKRIGPDMVLYYALSKHDQISSEKLAELHQRLLSQVNEALVDTTLCSIQELISEQKNLFKISQSFNSYTITKTKADSSFFDAKFLDRWYSPFFEKNEFNEIKAILMAEN